MEKNRDENKKDNFVIRMLKGFVIGVLAMLPGVSGGVMAVVLGVYRKAIDSIIDFFSGRNVKRSVIYLLTLGIGGVVGLFAVSFALEFILENFEMPLMYACLGMIMGGLPSFFSEAKISGGKFEKKYLVATVCGVAAVVGLVLIEQTLTEGKPWPVNVWTLMLGGAVLGFGFMVPGLSTSPLLMRVGIYKDMLNAFNSLDIIFIASMMFGILVMAAIMIILVKKAFERYPGYAYYSVFGFIIATVVFIFPGVEWSLRQLVSIVLMALGFIAALWMGGGFRAAKKEK